MALDRGVGRAAGGRGLVVARRAHDGRSPLHLDTLAWHSRWLALGFGAMLVLLGWRPLMPGGTSEYTGSLLLTIAGLMFVSGAGELVLLFVGLELISIPTYVLLSLGRRDASSQEATAKYFFLSVLSSAILLYGFSFLYGIAGFDGLGRPAIGPGRGANAAHRLRRAGQIGDDALFRRLVFQNDGRAVPLLCPDVYQGTTHPNAALLSVVPKAAGFDRAGADPRGRHAAAWNPTRGRWLRECPR